MIHGVEEVQIPIPRESQDKARAFYGMVLGLRELNRSARLGRGSGGVYFALPDGRELILEAADEFRPHRKPSLSFHVPDLESMSDTLGKAGHRAEWDFSDPQPRFYSQDPFGNLLAFVTVEA